MNEATDEIEHKARLVSVMDVAPAFALPDHRGGRFELASSLTPGGVVLVFYRGHWCPYCRRYLGKLRDQYARLTAHGAVIVAISPEPVETSAELARALALPFALLSDVGGAVIDAYGVRNGFTGARTLLPHPAVFVIDGNGRVRFRSVDRNYKKRTTLRTLFAEVDALAAVG